MSRQARGTDAAPAPGGAYSQAVVAGGFVYTAGMGPYDPVTGRLVGETVGEQTHQVMHNLANVLAACGLDLSDVVKATAHLNDVHRDFQEFNTAYADHFEPPYPVRTTVGSVLPGFLVEIDVVAELRS